MYFNKARSFGSLFQSLKLKLLILLAAFVVITVAVAISIIMNLLPPSDFPKDSILTIAEGMSVSQIANHLQKEHYISSPIMFRILAERSGKSVLAGEYFFDKPESVFTIFSRLSVGDQGLDLVRVTIPEGFNKSEIAKLLKEKIDNFDEKYFLANSKEGYLFPDTYFFSKEEKTKDVLKAISENFDKKMASIQKELDAFGRPLSEVLNMASIIEEEARTTETRRIISGILWKRLEIGMALQVDVTFQYVNGKDTYELTSSDLTIDSPYNTYKYAGLPPTPISNPGLDSIKAAITPTKTNYLYFLSSKQGTMYYAADFEGHKLNRIKYLD
jgi:UPF0755 protein